MWTIRRLHWRLLGIVSEVLVGWWVQNDPADKDCLFDPIGPHRSADTLTLNVRLPGWLLKILFETWFQRMLQANMRCTSRHEM